MNRRAFLSDVGLGFTGLALGSMLFQDGVAKAGEPGKAPPVAKAKAVIWLFMVGGVSHVESFDPKPELNKHAGKTIAESPHKKTLDSPYLKKNLREFVAGLHKVHPTIYPMQVGYKKRGKVGVEISDWWPHVGDCVDDLAIVRSMWTTDNDHGAQLQFHTGRHALEGAFPTIGTWDTTMKAGGMEFKGTQTFKMELGGIWLVGTLESDLGGQKFSGKSLDTYDAAKKKFVGVWADSMGTTPMLMEGTIDPATKKMTMIGDNVGPDGKMAKWKSVSEMPDADTVVMNMYVGDAKEPMFVVTYKRKK